MADGDLGGVIVAQHEFEQAVGQMQDAAGAAPPQHLELHTGPDAEGKQSLAQMGVIRQALNAHPAARLNLAQL